MSNHNNSPEMDNDLPIDIGIGIGIGNNRVGNSKTFTPNSKEIYPQALTSQMYKEKNIKPKTEFSHSAKNWFLKHIHPRKRLPVINWLPRYQVRLLQGDIISGLTVGLLLVPQSLAIADIVGGPVVHGLYSSLTGLVCSFLFSTAPDVSLGPTVVVAVISARYNVYNSPLYMSVASLFSGLVIWLAGVLNLGFAFNFVSAVVLNAFMTCGSVTIIVSQLPSLLGLKIPGSGKMPTYELIYRVFAQIKETKLNDSVIGFFVIIVCLVFHYTMPLLTASLNKASKARQMAKMVAFKTLWFISVSKNAILTIVLTAVSYHFVSSTGDHSFFALVGKLQKGFPVPWNPIQASEVTDPRTGETITKSIGEMMSDLLPLFFIGPIMMYIETLAVGKNFSKLKDYPIDASQELINVGFANILNAFFRGFPIGGGMSRSAVNAVSGVNTTLSGLVALLIVVLAVVSLTSVFYYIPKAILAGMLISAMIPGLNLSMFKTYWQVDRWEFLPWIFTFFVGLYALEMGMLCGLLLSASFILFRAMRPRLHRVHAIGKGVYSFRIRSSLYYPGSQFLTGRLFNFKKYCPELQEIDVDCHAMNEIDLTVANELNLAVKKLQNENVRVKFYNVKPGRVHNILDNIGLKNNIVDDNVLLPSKHSRISKKAIHLKRSNNEAAPTPTNTMQNQKGETHVDIISNIDELTKYQPKFKISEHSAMSKANLSLKDEHIDNNNNNNNNNNDNQKTFAYNTNREFIRMDLSDVNDNWSTLQAGFKKSKVDENFFKNVIKGKRRSTSRRRTSYSISREHEPTGTPSFPSRTQDERSNERSEDKYKVFETKYELGGDKKTLFDLVDGDDDDNKSKQLNNSSNKLQINIVQENTQSTENHSSSSSSSSSSSTTDVTSSRNSSVSNMHDFYMDPSAEA